MSAQPKPHISEAAYLAAERIATQRSEYVDGEVYLMAGGSYNHARVGDRAVASLLQHLAGKPCTPVSRDLRVKPKSEKLYVYPDVLIVCGKPEFADGHKDTLTNPTVVFEVLSESTERWDRGGKFAYYRQIETLQHYVQLSQFEPLAECFSRHAQGWMLNDYRGMGAQLLLPAVGISVPLAEVYSDIEFEPAPLPPEETRFGLEP